MNDLTKYLPKSESFDLRANLSNQEKRIEQLCDEERYRALTTNEEEEILDQGNRSLIFRLNRMPTCEVQDNVLYFFVEEELKRLQQALNNEKSYAEVGFTYENDGKSVTESLSKDTSVDEDEEMFIPPYQLDVPIGMKIVRNLIEYIHNSIGNHSLILIEIFFVFLA